MNKHFFSLILTTAVFAAVFSSCDKDDVTYTVTFDSKGGSAVTAQTVKQGDKVQKPADPTRANYSLAGWAKADNETSALWNFETETVTEDMTLFARWSINMYSVTFDSDGGSAVTTQNVAHGSTATKPADPTRNGYEFDGWFNGETEWNFSTAITAAITLKAKWTAVHIVTFDSDGGSTVPTQTIRNGNTATKPATDPTKDGFEFDGWFSGDTEWNFATPITAPITLKAKWTAVHIVTFDSDGGSMVSSQTVRNGAFATKPVTDPTKTIESGLYLGTPSENYTFDGWYNGETEWDFGAAITAPITLKARWSLPSNVTRIASVLSNDVGRAFDYVNEHSSGGEEYTLLIGTNVTAGEQTLNAANAKLTIRGIGTERTINATAARLFTINGNNITSLILGKNITLKRNTISSGITIVNIERGSLTMCDGSKITDAPNAGAVFVSGLNATFKMEGGEISGNNAGFYEFSGGVTVTAGGTFDLSGGRITGNTSLSHGADDTYINYNGTFRLHGNARIGTLILNANNATTRSSVDIIGNYSGTVTRLHLRGMTNTSSDVPIWWTNVPVIINGSSVINMFNNGLGDFRYGNGNSTAASIYATHVLNANGFLIPKEN